MPIVINPSTFNPSALTSPDVYEIVIPPQAYIPGAPASVSGLIGTASWGPLNYALLVGNTNDLNTEFGTISAASVSDIHDLATDVVMALNQGNQSGLSLQCVRVSDGSDTQASLVLSEAAASAINTITVGGTKTTDDVLTLRFANAGFSGGHEDVAYTVLSGDTLATITTALKDAINADSVLIAAEITATSTGDVITVIQPGPTVAVVTNQSGMGPTTTLTIVTTDPIPGGTLTALYSGILGNQIKITISAGASSTLCNVTLSAWGGKPQEYYPALPNTSAFWAALSNALSMGTGPTQGPSNLARFAPASEGSPSAPALITGSSLSGGTDGRSVDTADLIGDSASNPPTGIYATLTALPVIQQLWVVGLSDSTAFPDLVNLGAQNGILTLATVPVNTTVSDAITTKNEAGANHFEFGLVLDWVTIFDPINNVNRTITGTGVAGGLITALSPEQSPLNQEVFGILSTPRTDKATGLGPYSSADIGLANSNGIILLTKPIPLGQVFGIRTGVNTSPDAVTSPIEYSRMTNFILQSVYTTLGQFIGQLQSISPTDRLRANVKAVLDNFFNELENNGQLDQHSVQCDLNNNPPAQIAQHILQVNVQARYLSSVWFLIFTLQGGTTVQINASVITPGQV